LSQRYGDRVQFILIYIREAHPSDEWWLDSNKQADVNFAQPTSFEERQELAQSCSVALGLSMPCVVDDMQNSTDEAYASWPERLFVVDANGRIAYAGKQGPFGFEPEEVAAWLDEHVGGGK
jgi:hypothetical protein